MNHSIKSPARGWNDQWCYPEHSQPDHGQPDNRAVSTDTSAASASGWFTHTDPLGRQTEKRIALKLQNTTQPSYSIRTRYDAHGRVHARQLADGNWLVFTLNPKTGLTQTIKLHHPILPGITNTLARWFNAPDLPLLLATRKTVVTDIQANPLDGITRYVNGNGTVTDYRFDRANSLAYRASMSDAVRFFQDNQDAIAQHMGKADKYMITLYEFVEKSPARKKFGGDDAFRQISDQLAILLQRSVVDSVREAGKLKFLTSQVVGNTLGMVRWRAGKLKNDHEFLSPVSEALQPGDILLEKTPFALTDKTIPGHFGHAAIYIGTTDQLRAIGALDSPQVKAHLELIGTGHVVLEALRGGVVLNNLKHFMDIDDIAVLRPQRLSPEAMRDSIGLALSNYGKRYDFNFDVNTTETIVCSELVYAAYPQIDFVTKQVFTSFTISPDDIAKQAAGNPSDPLELTLFAHDGKLAYRKGDDIAGIALYRKLVGVENGRTDHPAFKQDGP